MKQTGSLRLVLFVQFTFLAKSVLALTGGEIVGRLQDRLEGYKTFSMDFEKEFYWAALDKTRSRTGKIYMQNPNQFRVGLDNGDVMVADGITVWSYVDRNKQVIISDYDGELRNPWQIFVDYSANFVPTVVEETKIAGRSAYIISMRERLSDSPDRWLKIWVDKKKWWLLKIEYGEENGDITTYRLKEHKVNKKLRSGSFSFVIPGGVEVLDRRISPSLTQ
ncbi:MAG: outer membrane lipoprotein carrier protein LolA [Candidatus Latescibacterota bacterium]|nr:outer membrane lipoprotein carrier protein LolA [Candidatus Latescibacterota bacterium]